MLLGLCPWNLLDTCNGGFGWLVLKDSTSVAKPVINRMAAETSSLPREGTPTLVRWGLSGETCRHLHTECAGVSKSCVENRCQRACDGETVRRDLSSPTYSRPRAGVPRRTLKVPCMH